MSKNIKLNHALYRHLNWANKLLWSGYSQIGQLLGGVYGINLGL